MLESDPMRMHWAWVEACGRRDDEIIERLIRGDSDMGARFEAAMQDRRTDMERATVWVGDIRVERFPMVGGGQNYAAWRRDPGGLFGSHNTLTIFTDDRQGLYGKVGTREYDGPDHPYGSDERVAAVRAHYKQERELAVTAIRAAFPDAQRHEMQV